ncbi:glycoside hydrolase family 2 protein [Jidongwangia harbinensis]|uniref:glycoside hydrolase family 2 protein n=1 Tax=Jidongwangia harbinensis TaxID=2878561 RepID=UPI001CD994E5|nr:glycoside hydrolase family 2 TIM barrel-domain containing protein [Jidongwangia harbinensis]MCA2217270.1 glycoside hydrolase family 2 protein [Jidongwangia harbinensis]
MIRHVPLHDGWTVSGGDVHELPATVPGCVHTDLLAAGLIEDPYLNENESKVAWIGRTGWVYETTFDHVESGDRTDLFCAGLDTVATIALNGVELGRTANMHRSYRFDARAALRPGRNRLRITFDSAYGYAEAQQKRLGDRPNAYPEPFHFIRKMACNFGWDWGPTLVTAGIWQRIGLESWSVARLAEVRPQVTVANGVGRVELRVRLERASAAPVTVAATVAGRRTQATITGDEALLILNVDDPELWWPRGYGEQHRYDLDVAVTDEGGEPLDSWSRKIGFRSVRLHTTPDADGTPFQFVVNDVPVFVRGVNWIPDDVFVTRITRERLAARFTQAVSANVNYLRVWGGGLYETDDFYDLADAYGLMVQQDFLFACAAYPEEEPFATEVEAEARENVVRLASHPSLVLWTGNNENIWGHEDWGWKEELGGRTWGAGYYFDLLHRVVTSVDPTRPYWPGSPYSGGDRHPNDPAHGTTHIWDVWNTDDYTKYREYRPRFVAEFGFQAPPAYATLRRAISDEPLAPDSPGMAHHQKAMDGDVKLQRGLDHHLPPPRDFDDWHYLTQLNQARAVSYGIEHFRSLRPLCAGTIMWQLNDCWPVTSWAAIDGDGRRKPLWYAMRHAYADRLLTVQPRDGAPAVVAVNDATTDWTVAATVSRRTLAGVVVAQFATGATVAPGSATTLALPPELATPADPAAEFLVVDTADGERAFWFFAEDRDISWSPASYDAAVDTDGDLTRVRVTAHNVLRDLTLQADRVHPEAVVDAVGVTVLPGETVTFTVSGATGLDPAALTAHPALRCVNDVA